MDSDENFKRMFDSEITATGLVIPYEKIKSIMKTHSELLLNISKLPNVTESDKPGHKVILFASTKTLPEALSDYERIQKQISLSYDNFSYFEVLQKLLPSDISIPTGFETIGHIAHFNLNPSQLKYKNIIGQVLLDVFFIQKSPNIKTVVTKLSKIDNVFRTFNMEIIAGEPSCITTLVKNN